MASEPIGYLLAAGARPLPLLAGKVVTLGREESNTIPVDDLMASRCHARIDCLEQAVRIEDLRSTNGTFLNGQRLVAGESFALHSDDEIRIGGKAFHFVSTAPGLEPDKVAVERALKFSQMRTMGWDSSFNAEGQKVLTQQAPGPHPPAPPQTDRAQVAATRATQMAMLAGRLGEGSLPQVLQFIHSGGMSGTLSVKCRRLEGTILFLDGQLYAAESAGATGAPAVYACALESEGSFSFEGRERAEVERAARNITENTIKIVFECCRRIDESQGPFKAQAAK